MLSTAEVAESLGVHERTVQRWIRQGRIRAKEMKGKGGKRGKVFMVPEEELERLGVQKCSKKVQRSGEMIGDIEPRHKQLEGLEFLRIDDTIDDIASTPKSEDFGYNSPNHNGLGGARGTDQGDWGTDCGTLGNHGERGPNGDNFQNINELPPFFWLSVPETQNLLGITERAIRKRCSKGKLRYRLTNGKGGNGGQVYEIDLTSLPPECQIRWLGENREKLEEIPEGARELLHPEARVELELLTTDAEEASVRALQDEQVGERLAAVEAVLAVPRGRGRDQVASQWAQKLGVCRATVYRWVKAYERGGISALARQKRARERARWSQEAVDYFTGLVLKHARPNKRVNVKSLYAKVQEKGAGEGWQVGSLDSAYKIARGVSRLLLAYGTGGRRMVETLLPPILRDYSDLAPFEIIVGDQHRFDFWTEADLGFWVVDDKTGRVFRPEGYFFQDLRTRLIYGFHIDRHYSSTTVAQALRMGLKAWGKFRCIYTDNGKPETSNFISGRGKWLANLGMRTQDMAELYRVEAEEFTSYALPNEDGNPLALVARLDATHRRALVRNAKAKLIERTFEALEEILLSVFKVPGRVVNKAALAEEQAAVQADLDRLAAQGKLLTYSEFVQKVAGAVRYYNVERVHRSLGHPPIEELWKAVKEEGFVLKRIDDETLDLMLLPSVTRVVDRSRVVLFKRFYEAPELLELHGRRVEVRYDPDDWNKAWAIIDDTAVPLEPVVRVSMKDPEATAAAIAKKRALHRQIAEEFRRLTKGIPDLLEYSRETRRAAAGKEILKKRAYDPENDMTPEEMEAEMARREAQFRRMRRPKPPRRPEHFMDEIERFDWCLKAIAWGVELSDDDRAFFEAFREGLSVKEMEYWNEALEMYAREAEDQMEVVDGDFEGGDGGTGLVDW